MHTSSFDVTTARDFMHVVVIPQYEEFLANNSSRRHALLSTIVVYHMYEWVHPKKAFNIRRFQKAYPADSALAATFDVARNVVNGTKHFESKVKTRAQRGFSSGFSDGFARPLLVQFPDGSEKSVDTFLRDMIDFWKTQESNGAF